MNDTYPRWRQSYSNEDMDRIQGLANRLTETDRQALRPAPPYGYSTARYEEAKRIVKEAQF